MCVREGVQREARFGAVRQRKRQTLRALHTPPPPPPGAERSVAACGKLPNNTCGSIQRFTPCIPTATASKHQAAEGVGTAGCPLGVSILFGERQLQVKE
jgi:hypothetical protein